MAHGREAKVDNERLAALVHNEIAAVNVAVLDLAAVQSVERVATRPLRLAAHLAEQQHAALDERNAQGSEHDEHAVAEELGRVRAALGRQVFVDGDLVLDVIANRPVVLESVVALDHDGWASFDARFQHCAGQAVADHLETALAIVQVGVLELREKRVAHICGQELVARRARCIRRAVFVICELTRAGSAVCIARRWAEPRTLAVPIDLHRIIAVDLLTGRRFVAPCQLCCDGALEPRVHHAEHAPEKLAEFHRSRNEQASECGRRAAVCLEKPRVVVGGEHALVGLGDAHVREDLLNAVVSSPAVAIQLDKVVSVVFKIKIVEFVELKFNRTNSIVNIK